MKNIVFGIALAMTMNVFANTVEQAEALWDVRGENVNNAVEAASIYGALAEAEADETEKARLLYKQSEAVYYVGVNTDGDKEKERIHDNGVKIAQKVIDMLEGTDDFDQEEILASGYMYLGSNLGKWAEARGIASSIGNKDKLIEAMEAIIDLGYEDVHEYGANRVLGRVFFKLPKIFGGDKKKAEKLLAAAFEETQADDAAVSVHGLNNLYYADVLKANKKKDKACEVLTVFAAQDAETLLETRIPETKSEIAQAKEMLADFGCK